MYLRTMEYEVYGVILGTYGVNTVYGYVDGEMLINAWTRRTRKSGTSRDFDYFLCAICKSDR